MKPNETFLSLTVPYMGKEAIYQKKSLTSETANLGGKLWDSKVSHIELR